MDAYQTFTCGRCRASGIVVPFSVVLRWSPCKMSPATKSKSGKLSGKVVKANGKVSSKPSLALPNHGNGVPSNVYNPVTGKFHKFDVSATVSIATSQNNGRLGTIDETENQSVSSFGTSGELDSMSNHNGSGEEDQKEKTTTSTVSRTEPVPGCDTDKREKIRQKNERKHQRQKERRAQDLHERCSGYLMSWKLDMLAQKIVAMGFSPEESTMALIQNEGRVEESIAWLLELSEENKLQISSNTDNSGKWKMDITAELAKLSDMVMKFKCTKQEVERTVVACEGDLEKAEETLKEQNQEGKSASSKLEEAENFVSESGLGNKMIMPVQNGLLRPQQKGIIPVVTQQRIGECNLSDNKAVINGTVDSSNKNLQSLRRMQPKPDWGRPPQLVTPTKVVTPMDKRWSNASSVPSISLSMPSSQQVAAPPSNPYMLMTSNEPKANMPSLTLREPVIVMQRPQSIPPKQNLASTSRNTSASLPSSTGSYPNGMLSVEMIAENGSLRPNSSYLGLHGVTAQQFVNQNHFRAPSASSVDLDSFATGWGTPFNSNFSASSFAVPSSPSRFAGLPSGPSPPSSVDWSSGVSTRYDYTRVDWRMDKALMEPSTRNFDSSSTWSTMFMGGEVPRPAVNSSGSAYIPWLQDGGLTAEESSNSSGLTEWSSPFAGKDLLSISRRYVTDSLL
ncbi:uncharacterized protein LOC122008748 isoform X1 [Zingiber officinale]|nr:uncharacterized protein LOC122008748 isoform X1 [Zingiber officinale]